MEPAEGRLLLSEVRLYLLLLGRDLFSELTDARSFFQARPPDGFLVFAIASISSQKMTDEALSKDILDLIDQCRPLDIVAFDLCSIFPGVAGPPILFRVPCFGPPASIRGLAILIAPGPH